MSEKIDRELNLCPPGQGETVLLGLDKDGVPGELPTWQLATLRHRQDKPLDQGGQQQDQLHPVYQVVGLRFFSNYTAYTLISSFRYLARGCPTQFRRPDPKETTADIRSPETLMEFALYQNSRLNEPSGWSHRWGEKIAGSGKVTGS